MIRLQKTFHRAVIGATGSLSPHPGRGRVSAPTSPLEAHAAGYANAWAQEHAKHRPVVPITPTSEGGAARH